MGCGVRSTDSPRLICVEESMEYFLDKPVLFTPDGVPYSQITGSSMQKGGWMCTPCDQAVMYQLLCATTQSQLTHACIVVAS